MYTLTFIGLDSAVMCDAHFVVTYCMFDIADIFSHFLQLDAFVVNACMVH